MNVQLCTFSRTDLAIFHCIPCQLDAVLDFGRDAEVFEEALVRRPELAPHGLPHALLCTDQLASFAELLSCLHPLQFSIQKIN